MRIIIITILVVVPLISHAQSEKESLFNEERTMDRRYTLYQSQFRITGGYNFDVYKTEFDTNGNSSALSDRGISQNQHSFLARLRYGIIDYLDFQVDLRYSAMNYRGEPVYIVAPPENSVQVFTDISTRGLEDVFLGLNGRFPIASRKIDLGGSGGFYLPSAKSQPDQPQHTFTTDALGDVINYYYLENWGYGVMSLYYKVFAKIRLEKIAFSGYFESKMPLGETEGILWSSQLGVDNNFIYQSSTYTKQIPQSAHINLLLEGQLYQWVNVFMAVDLFNSNNGWSEENGIKEALPKATQTWLNPGYEILVSNKLWLRQGIYLPVGGKSSFSQFRIQTTFYYNLFLN